MNDGSDIQKSARYDAEKFKTLLRQEVQKEEEAMKILTEYPDKNKRNQRMKIQNNNVHGHARSSHKRSIRTGKTTYSYSYPARRKILNSRTNTAGTGGTLYRSRKKATKSATSVEKLDTPRATVREISQVRKRSTNIVSNVEKRDI